MTTTTDHDHEDAGELPCENYSVLCPTCGRIGGSAWLSKADSDASWHQTINGPDHDAYVRHN